jgi:DNA replication and repair protein RecF
VLNNRNIALRNGQKDYSAWDKQLIYYGKQVDEIRKRYLEQFKIQFIDQTKNYAELKEIDFEYKPGWNQNLDFSEALSRRSRITNESNTHVGPHRAEISFSIENRSVKETLSRGQQKIFSIILVLSQLKLIKNTIHKTPILLIDDFDSELDSRNLDLIVQQIGTLSCQTFITSLKSKMLSRMPEKSKMFHVEQGEIFD